MRLRAPGRGPGVEASSRVIVIALQMISRMVISHYGWLESPVAPVSAFKILGALMLLSGAVLVVRN